MHRVVDERAAPGSDPVGDPRRVGRRKRGASAVAAHDADQRRRADPPSPRRVRAQTRGRKRDTNATCSWTPAVAHASTIASASSDVVATGFSHSTCLPAAGRQRDMRTVLGGGAAHHERVDGRVLDELLRRRPRRELRSPARSRSCGRGRRRGPRPAAPLGDCSAPGRRTRRAACGLRRGSPMPTCSSFALTPPPRWSGRSTVPVRADSSAASAVRKDSIASVAGTGEGPPARTAPMNDDSSLTKPRSSSTSNHSGSPSAGCSTPPIEVVVAPAHPALRYPTTSHESLKPRDAGCAQLHSTWATAPLA